MATHKNLLDKNRLLLPKRYEDSRKWFDTKLKSMSSADPVKSLGNNIVLFSYLPDSKKSTYSDMFPILFPIKITKDEITGFNLHYVPHIHRAYLFDNLKPVHNKRMKVDSSFIKSPAPMKIFSPSLKKYSQKNIKSKIIQISPDEWENALFLPINR
jgi:hypothetical protein